VTLVHHASCATTATAIDLGKEIRKLIHEYRGTHGGATDTDVRHALRFAELDTVPSPRRGTISVLMTGVILAGVFAYLFIGATSGPGRIDLTAMLAFGGTLTLGLVLVDLIARR
jgi:hypothetical protein